VGETLLQMILLLLDRLESPVILHSDAAGYPSCQLDELVSTGLLRETTIAEGIPRPPRFGPGSDLIVRKTARGLYGVADEDDYFAPVPLTEDDVRQYEISLPKLVDRIRKENGIAGDGFANHGGLIPLGAKPIGEAGATTVYLSLPNPDEGVVLARCTRLSSPSREHRVILLLPGATAFSPEARRIFGDSRVEILSLVEPAACGRLAIDWAILGFRAAQASGSADTCVFRKEGSIWTISFGGKVVHIADAVGLGYIAELLRHPRVAIEALELAGAQAETAWQVQASGIPMADETTIKAVKADLEERRLALARLQKNDWPRRGELQEEISKLEKYLTEVTNNRSQPRKVAGTAQRSRTAVTNAINRAIAQVSVEHPALGRHLKESIKTGTAPVYAPAELPDWRY
jgi:hypothetical protein